MKRLSIALALAVSVITGVMSAAAATHTAADVQRPPYGFLSTSKQSDYIADPDEMIAWWLRLEADSVIDATRRATGLDVAAVLVEDVEGDVDAFAKELYSRWNMGSRVSADNGVLIVVVKNRGGVGTIYAGPGTLSTLPRSALSKIERKKMTPYLRKHNYVDAVAVAAEQIQKVYADPKGAEAELDAAPGPDDDMNVWWIGGILAACVVIAVVMKIRDKKKSTNQ